MKIKKLQDVQQEREETIFACTYMFKKYITNQVSENEYQKV